MKKPYFYIIVPNIKSDFDIESNNIVILIRKLCNEYNLNPSEDIISDNTNNLKKEENLESLINKLDDKQKEKISKIIINYDIKKLYNEELYY